MVASMTARPTAGGDEHHPDDAANLAEIGEVLLAGIVLQIGVGDERADGVEHDRGIGAIELRSRHIFISERAKRALSVGIQGEQSLGVKQGRTPA